MDKKQIKEQRKQIDEEVKKIKEQTRYDKKNISSLDEIGEILKQNLERTSSIEVDLNYIKEVTQEAERVSYQAEQFQDLQINLLKENNDLLKNLINTIQEDYMDDDENERGTKKGLLSWFKNLLPGGFLATVLMPVFKKAFSKKAIVGLGKGIVKFLGASLLAVFSGFDFMEGWKNAKDITGREGDLAKYQAGVSKVLSGLLFGLIDPKAISKSFDKTNDYIFKNFTVPVMDFLNSFIDNPKKIAADIYKKIEKEFPVVEVIFKNIKNRIEEIKSNFMKYIVEPIENLYKSISTKIEKKYEEKMSKFLEDFNVKIDKPVQETSGKDLLKAYNELPFLEKMIRFIDPMNYLPKIKPKQSSGILNNMKRNFEPKKESLQQNTYNNILTNNNKTIKPSSVDMSTKIDDMDRYNFNLGF